MEYTKVASTAFEQLQMNAGIMLDTFNPATGEIGNIMGATSGGFKFASGPNYVDLGSGIDNVPPNTKQLKHITHFNPTMSGTFLTVTAALAKKLVAAGAIDEGNATHVIPAHRLQDSDFNDIWVVGDYSADNESGTGTTAGFVAIHIKNALNVDGMQWQTADKDKGQFAFNFTGHYDITDIEDVPFEVYVRAGASSTVVSGIGVTPSTLSLTVGETENLTAILYPSGVTGTVTWSSSASTKASVDSNGKVTALEAGSATITATCNGKSDTCSVTVAAASDT